MPQDSGRGIPIETTNAAPGADVERTRERIASPSFNRDGTVTHGPGAELGYDPADLPPLEGIEAAAAEAAASVPDAAGDPPAETVSP